MVIAATIVEAGVETFFRPGVNMNERSEPFGLFRLGLNALFVRHSLREHGLGHVYFRFNVTLANGDGFSDLSTLSIVQDQVSLARSYAKVL